MGPHTPRTGHLACNLSCTRLANCQRPAAAAATGCGICSVCCCAFAAWTTSLCRRMIMWTCGKATELVCTSHASSASTALQAHMQHSCQPVPKPGAYHMQRSRRLVDWRHVPSAVDSDQCQRAVLPDEARSAPSPIVALQAVRSRFVCERPPGQPQRVVNRTGSRSAAPGHRAGGRTAVPTFGVRAGRFGHSQRIDMLQ